MLTKTEPDAGGTRRRSWVGLLLPAIIAFVILIGLGVWQIQRKAWKEGLIADVTERLAAPPQALPPARDWPALTAASGEYRRVRFTAQFDNDKEALVFAAASGFRPDVADAGPGYWVFTPARLADGSTVMVNRGFVPDARKNPQSRREGEVSGPVALVGAMRWPDSRHWFTPNDDAAHNLWFVRDPEAIAAAKGLGSVAPFYVEQEAPMPPGGLPQPGKLAVSLPDNHLQYALTWFGLAAVLAATFIALVLTSSRSGGKEPPF
ncbi:MAG TPA: SURF1 family protein [Xanthobacteraceae bacterium]|jgi:surfeit locus 1 family protein|nr:SURF1 family protein [Xanthobacteraceae bacterium]